MIKDVSLEWIAQSARAIDGIANYNQIGSIFASANLTGWPVRLAYGKLFPVSLLFARAQHFHISQPARLADAKILPIWLLDGQCCRSYPPQSPCAKQRSISRQCAGAYSAVREFWGHAGPGLVGRVEPLCGEVCNFCNWSCVYKIGRNN